MPFRSYRTGAYSPTAYPTDVSYLVKPSVTTAANKVVVFCHGRSGSAFQAGVAPVEPHVTALVAAGFVVLGVDHARINSWGDPDSARALDDAYTYARTTLGFTATKVALMGWSMGGTTALNWIKRNASKVSCAWVWNPATDLRYFRDASGVYTPAYTPLNGAPQGNHTSEINTTYAPSTTANGAATIPASGGSPVTVNVAAGGGKSFADGHNSGVVGLPRATVNAVEFTYTGKTDNSLTGCVSTTGSSISVANAAAITGTYATQSNGYRIQDEPAAWAGIGVKIKVVQASDDATVPPGQNLDATNGWVARVNHADVTLRSPNPTGGHVNAIAAVPASEVVSFFQTNHV